MISILIGGDLCPNNRYEESFSNGTTESIINELIPEIQKSDLFLLNLECPLTFRSTPISKIGPNLRVSPDCISGIKKLGVDMVNMANNHILDQGQSGLDDTMDVCNKAQIEFFGAGKTQEEANKMLIKNIEGIKIAFWGCAEKEFSNASEYHGGANSMDLLNYHRVLKDEEGNFDKLIVLVHGGKEHFPFPSPRLQSTCRHFIEHGANAVIVQHTHIIGSVETYKGCPIVFGQGNFIFDAVGMAPKTWWDGFLVRLNFGLTDFNWNFIPFRQSQTNQKLIPYSNEELSKFTSLLNERGIILNDRLKLKGKWDEICNQESDRFLRQLNSFTRIFQFIFKKFKLERMLKKKDWYLVNLNIIQCESHRETIETILNNRK